MLKKGNIINWKNSFEASFLQQFERSFVIQIETFKKNQYHKVDFFRTILREI